MTGRKLVSDVESKECRSCKIILPISNFYKYNDPKRTTYLDCKKCLCNRGKSYRKNNPESEERKKERSEEWKIWISKNKEDRKIKVKDWRKRNPEKYKNSLLKWNYGIDTKDYENILNNQNNCCAICKINKSEFNYPLFIDHCHKTGKVRGLLCRNCNSAIGYFKDNIEIIKNSISYLEKFK